MITRLFKIKVRAEDKRDLVIPSGPDAFAARVRAKPERGQANAAVLALLGRHLGVNPKRLRIIKGAASPNKIVALLGAS